MTKDILEGTWKKSYSDQTQVASQFVQKAGVLYQPPKLLEAAVCILTEHVSSGVLLYTDNPWTYTRCEEKHKDGSYQMLVGGFDADGLVIGYHDFNHDYYGLSCLQRF